jgi:hypothetical protein
MGTKVVATTTTTVMQMNIGGTGSIIGTITIETMIATTTETNASRFFYLRTELKEYMKSLLSVLALAVGALTFQSCEDYPTGVSHGYYHGGYYGDGDGRDYGGPYYGGENYGSAYYGGGYYGGGVVVSSGDREYHHEHRYGNGYYDRRNDHVNRNVRVNRNVQANRNSNLNRKVHSNQNIHANRNVNVNRNVHGTGNVHGTRNGDVHHQ